MEPMGFLILVDVSNRCFLLRSAKALIWFGIKNVFEQCHKYDTQLLVLDRIRLI